MFPHQEKLHVHVNELNKIPRYRGLSRSGVQLQVSERASVQVNERSFLVGILGANPYNQINNKSISDKALVRSSTNGRFDVLYIYTWYNVDIHRLAIDDVLYTRQRPSHERRHHVRSISYLPKKPRERLKHYVGQRGFLTGPYGFLFVNFSYT